MSLFNVQYDEFRGALSGLLDSSKRDGRGRDRLLREYVSLPSEPDRFNYYLSDDGLAGFMIEEGEVRVMRSMFSFSEDYDGVHIAEFAARVGVFELDCYDEDGFLPKIFKGAGWVEVSRSAWDESRRPDVWNGGTPDTVRMRKNVWAGE